MYVEFKMQIEKQKVKKTKACFEDTFGEGLAFIRMSMAEGKSIFSIVPKRESNTTAKVLKSKNDFPEH